MKKFAALVAVALMAAPTVSLAASMAASNTVNSAAIVDGSVATADLANKAVTAAKIADSTITATQLANGAVTDAKITGPISVSKLPVGTTSTTVAAGNHTHDLSGYSKKYAKVAIVAQNSTGDYTSPLAAMSNLSSWCGTPSATNLCLIKVMPGVYDLVKTPLVMKSYVYLEGSNDSSVIKAAINNVDFDTCTTGTIIMADNSAIRNVMVVNTAPDSGNGNLSAAVVFNNVKAEAEEIRVLVGLDNTANVGTRNNGVCVVGANSYATLNNVKLETRNSGYDAHSNPVIILEDGSARITNSRLTAFTNNDGSTHVIDCVQGINNTGTLDVLNTVVEGTIINGGAGYNSGLWINDCKASVSNSIVKLVGGSMLYGAEASNADIRIVNTQFYLEPTPEASDVNGIAFSSNGTTVARISNSLITGSIPNLTNMKLFNNYDADNNPIPNQ